MYYFDTIHMTQCDTCVQTKHVKKAITSNQLISMVKLLSFQVNNLMNLKFICL